MKLLIVESGEYSDFAYVPLAVPDDFDLHEAARRFKETIWVGGEKPQGYKVGGNSFAGFLTKEYAARDPEIGELLSYLGSVDDPIHYSSWVPIGKPWEDIDDA